MASPIPFAIVGSGYRAVPYWRVARELPEKFRCVGVLSRRAERREELRRDGGVEAPETLDELLALEPKFVVVSVPWGESPKWLRLLSERGVPVLAETPPAPDLEGLRGICDLLEAKIQVAEQYHLRPLHAAHEKIGRSGLLGKINHANVAVAHGYHGLSLMRRLLGVNFEAGSVEARSWKLPISAPPGREGPPNEEKLSESSQTLAIWNFQTSDGPKVGIFDWCGDQYFSPIRNSRVLVRGERGEIRDLEVAFLQDFQTPFSFSLRREEEFGGLGGFHLRGLSGNGQWWFQNSYPEGRLNDDDLAIAAMLEKMALFCDGGAPFYPLAEAIHDHYLGLLTDQAAKSGQKIEIEREPWMK